VLNGKIEKDMLNKDDMTYSEYFTIKLSEARAIEAFFQRLRERLIKEKKEKSKCF